MGIAVSNTLHRIDATAAPFAQDWSRPETVMPTGSSLVRGLVFAVPLSLALWAGLFAALRAIL